MIIIDIDDRNEANLPIEKRKFVNVAWLKFLSKPLRRLLQEYYDHRKLNELLIHMNGQVIYLEHILNYYFDDVNQGIYITDGTQIQEASILYNEIEGNEETILYNEAENEEQTYLFNSQELLNWPNFIIHIPSTVVFNEQQLRALVNRFKLASKNYIIEIV